MSIFKSYRGLYFATFLMLLGTGLLSTFLAFRSLTVPTVFGLVR